MFFILAAIFLVGLLAKVVSDRNMDVTAQSQRASTLTAATDIKIYAGQIKQAIETVLNNNNHTVAELDDVAAHEAAFDTAPHSAKIYHPYGGGAPYHSTYLGWVDIIIADNIAIDGVSTATSEVTAVGKVNAELCRALAVNNTPAVVTDVAANSMLDSSTAVTLSEGSTCQTNLCNGFQSHCVENTSGNLWIFYSVMLPR